MKDDRTTDNGDAYDPLIAAANAAHGRANQAGELALAALAVQIGILQGMINAGLVDAKAMRAWLQSLVDQLNPLERVQLRPVPRARDRASRSPPGRQSPAETSLIGKAIP
jgi:hypothetical protein